MYTKCRAFDIIVHIVTTIIVPDYNFGVSNCLDFQKARSGLGQSIKKLTQPYCLVRVTPASCSGGAI